MTMYELIKTQVKKWFSILLSWVIIFCKSKKVCAQNNLSKSSFDHILPKRELDHSDFALYVDRISELPECIIHQILSSTDTFYNPSKSLVRMSVLSKNWFHLTASFPILDFDMRRFRTHESFFKYVEYATSRFCSRNVAADTLKLIASLEHLAELLTVKRCLDLILKKDVKVLVIDITYSQRNLERYRLPDILLSVSLLKSLTIYGCELPSSLMTDVVNFKSLIQLTLESVSINDEVIKYLTTSCPLLQNVHIIHCHGLKRFCVHGHQNLQQVFIEYYTPPVEIIDIDAPNLSDLLIIDDANARDSPLVNLASCKKLTTFTYPLTNSNGFTDFLSNFPLIETLCLITRHGQHNDNLKLSSDSLKTLLLSSNCDLEETEFSTPNLILLIYAHKRGLHRLMFNRSWPQARRGLTHLKSCMHCYSGGNITALWFQKLRTFLDKKNGLKVSNLYINSNMTLADSEELKAIEFPPYELEHVELQLNNGDKSSHLVAFVVAVLWCCRPQSLTLRSPTRFIGFEELGDVVKVTYEKLVEQEDKGHTNIEIVSSSSSEAQKKLMALKTSTMGLPPPDRETISFIKVECMYTLL